MLQEMRELKQLLETLLRDLDPGEDLEINIEVARSEN